MPSPRRIARALLLLALTLIPVAIAAPASGASASPPTFITSWPVSGTALATDGLGRVLVADPYEQKVRVYTDVGVPVAEWGSPGTGPGQFGSGSPTGLATDTDGNVYVADPGNQRIQVFSSSWAHLRTWGGAGTGPGQLGWRFSIALSPGGEVFVHDMLNARVQVFDKLGQYLREFPAAFQTPDGGIGVDAAGRVVLGDVGQQTVRVLNGSGLPLDEFGDPCAGSGCVAFPQGIAVDLSNRVYATRPHHIAGLAAVRIYGSDGELLTSIDDAGSPPGVRYPTAVATDRFDNVYVLDIGVVRKFGPIAVTTTSTSWGRIKALYR